MSYDELSDIIQYAQEIERSPDHWWVTIIGIHVGLQIGDWKVTRSLVSYDPDLNGVPLDGLLKGHQIIGELR